MKATNALETNGRTGQEPDLEMLLASVIRLLASEHANTCAERSATLTRILNYLSRHPALSRSPALAAAIAAAQRAWSDKLLRDEITAATLEAGPRDKMH
jgi:hypothetical protein